MSDQYKGDLISSLESAVDTVMPQTKWCPYKTNYCTPLSLCPKCKIAFGMNQAEWSGDDDE